MSQLVCVENGLQIYNHSQNNEQNKLTFKRGLFCASKLNWLVHSVQMGSCTIGLSYCFYSTYSLNYTSCLSTLRILVDYQLKVKG